MHPLTSIFKSGKGSGCQGCDPDVVMPIALSPIRLCSDCLESFPQNSSVSTALELVRERRMQLGISISNNS